MSMFKSFYSLFFFGLVFLTACEAPEPGTRLDFVAGDNLTSQSGTITAGEIITSSLYARSASSNNQLTRFVVSRIYDTTSNAPLVYLDTTFKAQEYGMTFVFGSRGVNGSNQTGREYWQFTVIDEQGKEYQKQYTLQANYPNARQPINTFSSYYFHRNSRENIRYFSTRQGIGFPGYIGRAHPILKSEPDFYFEEGPQLTLTLSGVNGTKLKATALTPADFTNAATPSSLTNYYDQAGVETDTQSGLRKDDVVAFKTGPGKTGLILIKTFETARDTLRHVNILRRAPYDVKVRK